MTNLLQVASRGELRQWLMLHHRQASHCWVVIYRSACPPQWAAVPYVAVVEEALCFGWIDSTLKKLPDGRLVQRLSPRRARSHWTELNRQRCARLEAIGLMTDAGREAWQAGNEK